MKISHLNALRALEATLRLGSFTAAARELGVTPAAVGQRVRSLEDYIGRPLFDRSATGAAPTAEARKMMPALNGAFSALAGALEEMRPNVSAQRVAITMPESFAENWFALEVADFTRRHPAADLRLDASNRDHDLTSDDFDFAIRYGAPLGPPFDEVTLFGDSVQPVCSPAFADRHDLGPDRSDLTDVPLIHALNRTGDPGWVGFQGWARAFDLDASDLGRGVRFSKAGSGLQSAIAGQGLVMAGLVESYHALRAGNLVMPFGPNRRHDTAYMYRLVTRRDARASPIKTAFSEWIEARARRFNADARSLLAGLSA